MNPVRWQKTEDWKDGILFSSLPPLIRSFAYIACPSASTNRKGEKAKGDDCYVYWPIETAEPVDIAKYLQKIKINAKKETNKKAGKESGKEEGK